MDWNKSNTILIIAFIILNVFLMTETFSDSFNDKSDSSVNLEFENNVVGLLRDKNITLSCNLPDDSYTLPVLETEYEVIVVNNELIQKYLGSGVEAVEDIYSYSNDKGEMLDIVDNKKIIYTVRQGITGAVRDGELINQAVELFLKTREIDKTGYAESKRFISEKLNYIEYNKTFKDISIDNSYMRFYIDGKGIYKFEMQRINLVEETKNKTKMVHAIEALPRLITYEDVRDKDIKDIKMSYYSKEDDGWKYITGTNSDPTWKVVFSDGTEKHLPSFRID